MRLLTILAFIVLTIGCQCPTCPEIIPDDPPEEPPVATIDWAASANGGILSVTGPPTSTDTANVYDSDDATGSSTYYASYPPTAETFEITLSSSIIVTQFRARVRGKRGAGIYPPAPDFSFYYYTDTWYLLESWTGNEAIQEKIYTTAVAGVTKIRMVISNLFISGGDKNWGYIYSLNAYGNYYIDKGIRFYNGATTKKIGVEALDADHKVRIRIGDVTYGVPIVATDHTQASAVRVRVGGTTYSFVDVA